MPKTIRVIPRLDIKGPNLVKGIQLDGHRVLGTAEEFAKIYYQYGADELIYQDTVASLYRRNSLLEIVSKTARDIFIPLTVAGGIRSCNDIRQMLRAGADKVAINTAATENPNLLSEAARLFGSQCIVSSIEAFRLDNGKYEVWVDYGRERTNLNAIDWAAQVEDLGVGEILLTSINNDGMGVGYDLELIEKISSRASIPVIACGGAGKLDHFVDATLKAGADAVSAASIFHYHYALPKVGQKTMQFQGDRLRMGEHIDSGNIDFLNYGYGGIRSITVDPCDIMNVKSHLKANSVNIRS
ncbi:MAG: imidazole glycerol phosphate synthase subunit HisF [Candidatus Nitrohelix vancouverensis]|uniref:imidazole glycerol-phosphate synthase n=1 Tax=Candidatus Nitrohelix vancouverensis TaxID=2705534 RepID=A0A7T0G279_9BACT|nr:MAG: imidazole glycerol phosphate synthase subunit HisF [Candidatus Nitrohelix vancouverensis]